MNKINLIYFFKIYLFTVSSCFFVSCEKGDDNLNNSTSTPWEDNDTYETDPKWAIDQSLGENGTRKYAGVMFMII